MPNFATPLALAKICRARTLDQRQVAILAWMNPMDALREVRYLCDATVAGLVKPFKVIVPRKGKLTRVPSNTEMI
jgi:hypothetical protein